MEPGPIPREPHRGGVPEQKEKTHSTLLKAANVFQNPTTYKYKNIDYNNQIRVLKIYRGAAGTDLECRLLPCALLETRNLSPSKQISNCIPYTALSYYWGTDVAKNMVYMYDADEEQKLFAKSPKGRAGFLKMVSFIYIQDNLNKALRQIRSDQDDVYVWADALCIFQKDVIERSAQVARMHDVYMQAKDVCIWLGDANGHETENKRTFEFLREILDLQQLEQYVKRLKNKETAALKDRDGVYTLMKSDWFQRRWVIQELALAAHAYVSRGDCKMDWPDFADSIALFMMKHDYSKRAHDRPTTYDDSRNHENNFIEAADARALGANVLVTATSNFFRRSNKGQILQRLLSLEQLVSSMLLAFEASDPKDTVFAVLQIAKDTFRPRSTGQPDSKLLTPVFRYGILPLIGVLMWRFDIREVNLARLPFLLDAKPIFGSGDFDISLDIVANARQFIQVCIFIVMVLFIWLLCTNAIDMLERQLFRPVLRWTFGQNKKFMDKRIEPKYEKCIVDVFGDFIEYCIETSDSLDVLCRHWAPYPTQSADGPKINMPSWVLSIKGHAFGGDKKLLHTRINGDSLVGGSDGRGIYRASGNLRPYYKFGKNKEVPQAKTRDPQDRPKYADPVQRKENPQRFDGTLTVKGIQLAIIAEAAEITGNLISRTALEILGWSAHETPTEATIDQIWRTLVANRGLNGTNPPSWYRRACQSCLEWYNEQGVANFSTERLKTISGTPPAKIEFLERVQQVVFGRKCFRAVPAGEQELVGLAPPKAQAGDLICVLFGCSVPVVIRDRKPEKGYMFIGECYVHGMMDGEAVDPMPGRSKIRYFTLR